MRALLCVVLIASQATFASEPDDSPVLAPDVPEVSVRLRPGETAPFDGRLLSLDENVRRAKSAVECRAELASAKESVWMSKPTIIALVAGALLVGAAAGAAGAWAATRR